MSQDLQYDIKRVRLANLKLDRLVEQGWPVRDVPPTWEPDPEWAQILLATVRADA